MEIIRIQLNKGMLSLIALVLFIFSIIGFFFFLGPENFTSSGYDDDVFIRIIGLVMCVLGVPGLLILGRKITSPQMGLLINEEGITDNGTGSSIGLVHWKDIMSLRMTGIPNSKMLLIMVREPQKYINQGTGKLVRFFLRLNNMIYGSPIVIPTITLNIKEDDLETKVMEALKKRS